MFRNKQATSDRKIPWAFAEGKYKVRPFSKFSLFFFTKKSASEKKILRAYAVGKGQIRPYLKIDFFKNKKAPSDKKSREHIPKDKTQSDPT
jgi:hypothetical protein